MFVSFVAWVQYTSQESYRGIPLLHKHWKPMPNSKKKPPKQTKKPCNFQKMAFCLLKGFSPSLF